jgi:hypothetical protein
VDGEIRFPLDVFCPRPGELLAYAFRPNPNFMICIRKPFEFQQKYPAWDEKLSFVIPSGHGDWHNTLYFDGIDEPLQTYFCLPIHAIYDYYAINPEYKNRPLGHFGRDDKVIECSLYSLLVDRNANGTFRRVGLCRSQVSGHWKSDPKGGGDSVISVTQFVRLAMR